MEKSVVRDAQLNVLRESEEEGMANDGEVCEMKALGN